VSLKGCAYNKGSIEGLSVGTIAVDGNCQIFHFNFQLIQWCSITVTTTTTNTTTTTTKTTYNINRKQGSGNKTTSKYA
jgi:hypothetical protein